MHSSPTIPRPFFTLGIVTNQAGSPSVDPNDVHVGKTSGGENTISVTRRTSDGGNTVAIEFNIRNEGVGEPKRDIDSIVRNEGAGESNGDTKIGLEV